jgi:hypothetical protein
MAPARRAACPPPDSSEGRGGRLDSGFTPRPTDDLRPSDGRGGEWLSGVHLCRVTAYPLSSSPPSSTEEGEEIRERLRGHPAEAPPPPL